MYYLCLFTVYRNVVNLGLAESHFLVLILELRSELHICNNFASSSLVALHFVTVKNAVCGMGRSIDTFLI